MAFASTSTRRLMTRYSLRLWRALVIASGLTAVTGWAVEPVAVAGKVYVQQGDRGTIVIKTPTTLNAMAHMLYPDDRAARDAYRLAFARANPSVFAGGEPIGQIPLPAGTELKVPASGTSAAAPVKSATTSALPAAPEQKPAAPTLAEAFERVTEVTAAHDQLRTEMTGRVAELSGDIERLKATTAAREVLLAQQAEQAARHAQALESRPDRLTLAAFALFAAMLGAGLVLLHHALARRRVMASARPEPAGDTRTMAKDIPGTSGEPVQVALPAAAPVTPEECVPTADLQSSPGAVSAETPSASADTEAESTAAMPEAGASGEPAPVPQESMHSRIDIVPPAATQAMAESVVPQEQITVTQPTAASEAPESVESAQPAKPQAEVGSPEVPARAPEAGSEAVGGTRSEVGDDPGQYLKYLAAERDAGRMDGTDYQRALSDFLNRFRSARMRSLGDAIQPKTAQPMTAQPMTAQPPSAQSLLAPATGVARVTPTPANKDAAIVSALELAMAYEESGNEAGARELLEKVLAEKR